MTWETEEERRNLADDRDRMWDAWPRGCGEARIPMEKSESRSHTVAELLSEDQEKLDWPLIRRLAGEVMNPDKTNHRLSLCGDDFCPKCGERTHDETTGDALPCFYERKCPVADPAEGPLEVITERLLHRGDKYWIRRASNSLKACRDLLVMAETVDSWFAYYATPAQRCFCCLVALGKASASE